MTDPDGSKHFRLRGGAAELFESTEPEVLIEGPSGTGKSTALLLRLYSECERTPRTRAVILRATRASLTESILAELEANVLPARHPALNGADRASRRRYDFANGSALVVGGLDNADRIMSASYDFVAVFEATEITETDWEKVTTRLRGRSGRNRQAFADCNPAHPSHWLNRRASTPKMRRILSRHKDNPSITAEYLERLAALTGVRKRRLCDGIWAAAEGIVWDGFDPDVHVVASAPECKTYIGGVDWGYSHAGVLQVWGIDGDGRMYLVEELYRQGWRVEAFADAALAMDAKWNVEQWACDPARPDAIDDFVAAGLNATKANNNRQAGLNAVRARLAPASDGAARLFIVRGASGARDHKLESLKLPTCLEDEIPGYVYPQWEIGARIRADEPDGRCVDHACDAARYAVMLADSEYVDVADDPVVLVESSRHRAAMTEAELDERFFGDAD